MKYFVASLICALYAYGVASSKLTAKGEPRDGFVTINTTQYWLSTLRETWLNASSKCNDLSLRLVGLQQAQENDDVREYLRIEYPFGQWWTSGQRQVGGQWTWTSTGETFGYTDWDAGEPNINQEEACMNVRGWYGWYDDPCDAAHYYICE